MKKKKIFEGNRTADPGKEGHSQVFCEIRDGLLEAIELEKRSGTDRAPFDLGPDPLFDSPEHFAKEGPEATFIPAGSASRDAHGHRYGSALLALDDVMIERLRNGEQLAVEIRQGEYILYIQYGSRR